MSGIEDRKQIQIRLRTEQPQYVLPEYALTVHNTIVTKELNILVNKLLKDSNITQKNVEFEFLVSGHFLRTSLAEHIAERKVSTEDVINIVCVEKLSSPQPKDCLIHDDWVSAVAINGKWILTGCYDNTLHIWTSKGDHYGVINRHIQPVKAVAWVSLDDDNACFISASMDHTCMIWSWNIKENTTKCLHVCKGHKRSVESLGVNYDKTLMATGSWDSILHIWSTSLQDDDNEESESKRAKSDQESKLRVPKHTLKGHKQSISQVIWSDKSEIITGSMDHTIKIWDLELGGIKHEVYGDKSILDIDYSPLSRTVIAGSVDQHVRLFDPRSTEGTIVKAKFTSHANWVSTVRWSTVDEHLFISGAYDNVVKLWDTRSSKVPLFDLIGHEDKVLSSDWSNPKQIVSGSADNTLRIFKSKHTAR